MVLVTYLTADDVDTHFITWLTRLEPGFKPRKLGERNVKRIASTRAAITVISRRRYKQSPVTKVVPSGHMSNDAIPTALGQVILTLWENLKVSCKEDQART